MDTRERGKCLREWCGVQEGARGRDGGTNLLRRAEFGDGAVEHVDMVEKVDGYDRRERVSGKWEVVASASM